MKTIIGLLLAIIGLLSPVIVVAGGGAEQSVTQIQAGSGETRTVTDHAGNTVEIPVNPQRIACVSWIVLHNLYELGANVIGITGGKKADGTDYVYGMEEIFNAPLASLNLINYGRFDIELIKASKPDLIMGTPFQANKHTDTLNPIAPIVLVDGKEGAQIPYDIAKWIGKEDKYNELKAKYQERLYEVKAKFTIPPEKQTAIFFYFPNPEEDKVNIYYNFGAINVVSRDLGFQPTAFEKENYQDKWGEAYSIEILPEIFEDADYIGIQYSASYGHTRDSVLEILDMKISGWRKIMKAYKNNKLFFLEGEKAFSYSLTAYTAMLDVFAKYAK